MRIGLFNRFVNTCDYCGQPIKGKIIYSSYSDTFSTKNIRLCASCNNINPKEKSKCQVR